MMKLVKTLFTASIALFAMACGSDPAAGPVATPGDGGAVMLDGGAGTCDGGICRMACTDERQSCDGDSSNGCESDRTTDPKNCGTCGRDCGSTGCVDGICKVDALVDGAPGVEKVVGFVLDATSLYYTFITNTGDERVMRMPLSGGAPSVLASGTKVGRTIAVDGSTLYWVGSDTQIRKIPIGGGAIDVLGTVGPIARDTQIAIDGSFIYWVLAGSSSDPGKLKRISTQGGMVEDVFTEPSAVLQVGLLGGVATYGGSVFWANSNQIKRAATTGGTPAVLGAVVASTIAVDESGVYFSTGSQLQALPLGGGVPRPVASSSDAVFAIDETNVYLRGDPGHPGLTRTSKAGGSPKVIVPESAIDPGGQSRVVVALGISGPWLYWASGAKIRRIVK